MNREEFGQKETADRLIAALRQEEFVLYTQAIVPLIPDAEEPAYREILVRFLEEEEKLLPPGSFIPILEGYHLMPYLDRWVVNRAARSMRAIRRGNANRAAQLPRNSINLSSDTLHDRSFAPFVLKQVAAAGIPGATFSFEIMCSDAIRLCDQVCAFAEQIRPAGCTFSVASCDGEPAALEMLQRVMPGFVKIRSGLIGRMDRDPMSAARVDVLNRRCHSMGIRTIAEHVERPETLEILRQAGVDFAQGFLVGCPEPID